MEALPTSYRSYGSNDFEVSPERAPPQMQPYQNTTSNVTVVVNQPTLKHNQLMVTTTLDGHRTWSTGLFDCFSDMANCKSIKKITKKKRLQLYRPLSFILGKSVQVRYEGHASLVKNIQRKVAFNDIINAI